MLSLIKKRNEESTHNHPPLMRSFLLLVLVLIHPSWARTCEYDWIVNSAYTPCGPDDTVSVSPNASLASCFETCVAEPECKSFRLNVRSDCLASSCRPAAKRRGRSDFGVLRGCKEDLPSSSAPSPRPTAPPSLVLNWVSPTGIPKSAKMDWTAFYVPKMSACETLRPSKMGRTVAWAGWGGTLEDCSKECLYDTRCGGFILTNDGTCVKSTSLEKTDVLDATEIAANAFVKNGFSVSYWSGVCSTAETEEACEAFPTTCGWRMGKRGVNQMRIIEGGWCGRVAC